MKDLKKMTKKERKETLISIAEEVQELCEFEPAIKTDGKSEKELIELLTEAYAELTPEDALSKDAKSVFEFLGLREVTEEEIEDAVEVEEEEEEEVETPKKKAPAKKKAAPKKAKMEVVQDEEEEEEEEQKPKAKAKAKPKKEKVEGQLKMALFMDQVVEGKGSFAQLAVDVTDEYKERGVDKKCTTGQIKSHVKYRVSQDAKWLKSRKLKMTEDGIQ